MTINVTGPGGVVVPFPDDTDAETIDRTMRQRFGSEPPDFMLQKQPLVAPPGAPAGYVDQAIQGMPIAGPALQMGGAALGAAVQPMLGQLPDTTFGQRYDANLDFLRRRSQQFEQANPAGSLAANVAGGLAAGGGAATTQLGARALGMVGGLPERVLQGSVGGAGIGAADAALRGQSPAVGAITGAGLGAAGPIAGQAVGGLTGAGMRNLPLPGPLQGFERGAVSKVARAAGDDAIQAEAMRRMGPAGMLVDLGPNLRLQGEALATQPGPASRIMQQPLQQRFDTAGARISQGVDEALGPQQNFRETMTRAIAERRAAADQFYGQAWQVARPVNVTPAIDYIDAVRRPGASGVISQGQGPLPTDLEQALGNVRQQLAGANGAQRTDAQQLHLVKQSLDDMIDAAARAGRGNEANHIAQVRNRVVDALDTATTYLPPGSNSGQPISLYREARTRYRSDSAIVDALDEGRELFRRSTRPDDLTERVRDMSQAERLMFRVGARDAVDEVMGNVRNDALGARTLFQKEWNRQKLEAVIGPDRAQQLFNIIDRESRMAESFGAIQRGSQTRGRMAAGEEFPSSVAPTKTTFANPTTLGLVELAGKKAINALRGSAQATRLDAETRDAARLLTRQGTGDDMAALVDALRTVQARNASGVPGAVRDIATLGVTSQEANPLARERTRRMLPNYLR